MEELLREMQKIGFTKYETKIYVALLQHNPSTGYELSKLSGVPQAKVYEYLTRLSNSGIVLTIGSEPSKYVPLPPEELLSNANARFKKTMDFLEATLPEIKQNSKADYVWNIKEYNLTMEKAVNMINEAKNEIVISLWDHEALHLKDVLIRATERDVKLNMLLYGNAKMESIQNIHYHGAENKLMDKVGARWLTVVVDGNEVLTGQVDPDSEGVSIWTKNTNIVFISLRAMEHEIFIAKKE